MVWSQLEVSKAHVAYAVLGMFATLFSLISLFVKEKLYIGESTVAAIVGLIVGPHCLDWFAPDEWGNVDLITLELSRVLLCLQIFAVAVELPKKYMLKHWLSVAILLLPVMTIGWLVVGAFMYLVFDKFSFPDALLVAACITATDPVLAAAVVGKGKFAQRVPGHLRNLLSAESGCNDGMAFPFIFLSLNLIVNKGKGGLIVKNWICITILYQCIFGCILGAVIGKAGRYLIKYAESKELIDRESFLAFYFVLAITCAGFGSVLGVDDLLVSFAAGAAFAWDGWFAKKTEESHVSTVIDLILNLAYFVYFGAIIPWEMFNKAAIGLNIWRLIIMAIVIIFLRRIPAVMMMKPFTPDIKTWREALFCGHFGPIGVGAIFAAILARGELEKHSLHTHHTPLEHLPPEGSPYHYVILTIWPIVTFLVLTSIVVHGSSVAVITLGRHLNTITLTKSFTTTRTNTQGNSRVSNWMSRLPALDKNGRSFSLQRIDTDAPANMTRHDTIETSGVPHKPAGGMKRRKKHGKKRRRPSERIFRTKSREDEIQELAAQQQRIIKEKEARAATFALGGAKNELPGELLDNDMETPTMEKQLMTGSSSTQYADEYENAIEDTDLDDEVVAYTSGDRVIVEDSHGEVLDNAQLSPVTTRDGASVASPSSRRSSGSLKRIKDKIRGAVLEDTERGTKYQAYKVDSELIIENEDGEIVRRYRINMHNNVGSTRSRSSTLTGSLNKVLSSVGLKSETQEPTELQPYVSQPVRKKPVLTPAPTLGRTGFSDIEENGPSEEVYSSFDETDDTDDDSLPEETEFERSRRLAAIGAVNAPRDEDDEEE